MEKEKKVREALSLERALMERLSQSEIRNWLKKYAMPYQELMSCYRCALMEVETKFNVLDEELSLLYDRNPIESSSPASSRRKASWIRPCARAFP